MDEHGPHRKSPPPKVKQRCTRCRGSGRSPCQFCNGSGQVVTGRDVFGHPQQSTCSACFGLKTTRCKVCAGEGLV